MSAGLDGASVPRLGAGVRLSEVDKRDEAFGYADRAAQVSNRVDTRFPIASMRPTRSICWKIRRSKRSKH